MKATKDKSSILKELTDDVSVVQAIISYTENRFTKDSSVFGLHTLPFPDEPYVPVWIDYLNEADESGEVFNVLKSRIVQFQFPVEEGISKSAIYRGATLKGIPPERQYPNTSGIRLNAPKSLSLIIHDTLAGKIPVLMTPDQEDFQMLVQALSHKNEPVTIPKSMGAAMISGLNNWDRISRYKRIWVHTNPSGNWGYEFAQNVIPQKSIYQDRLIVLSKQYYSGISGEEFDIERSRWLNYSLQIRLEHECAHFFTMRYFGCMSSNMHDELIADYMGITKVLGKFDASWFLKFIGLEDYPTYRLGGRFENYTNNTQISPEAFKVLSTIVFRAALNVERFDSAIGKNDGDLDRAARLLTLCSVDLLTMSTDDGVEQLVQNYMKNKMKL